MLLLLEAEQDLVEMLLMQANNTKIIARVGVGLDNIDIKATEAKGIRVNQLS